MRRQLIALKRYDALAEFLPILKYLVIYPGLALIRSVQRNAQSRNCVPDVETSIVKLARRHSQAPPFLSVANQLLY